MRIQIPKRYRARLSRAYLDWAETLPRFGGGPVNLLQELRESQRSQSEDTYQRTRPPQGIGVQYLFFRLFELFQIEDFARLQKLLELFPKPEGDSEEKSLSQQFSERAKRISGGAWWNLGTLSREGARFGIKQATRRLTDLPEEVDQVDVRSFQLLPSVFVVTYDVRLNHKAAAKLSRLLDNHYLPEIVFEQFIPRGVPSHSYNFADAVMSREIVDWLEELRGKVESSLRPYASGYFMQHSPAKLSRLPAFEIFVVKGIGEMKNGLSAWLQESRMWLRTLGFAGSSVTYTNNEVLLFPSENAIRLHESPKPPHRLVILWEPYVAAKGKPGNEVTAASAIYDTQFLLEGILPFFALLEFLNFVQTRIEDLRQAVFRDLNSGWLGKFRLGPQIGLSDRILQESFLLERLMLEFKQNQPFFSSAMKAFTEDAAKFMRIAAANEGNPKWLRDDLQEAVKDRMGMLRENVTLIKNWFSEYSTLRTTAATSYLNTILVLLTFVLVILTVVLIWLTNNLAQTH